MWPKRWEALNDKEEGLCNWRENLPWNLCGLQRLLLYPQAALWAVAIKAANNAAVEAMRMVFDTVNIDGVVVIGEGRWMKLHAIHRGESGHRRPPQVDVAVDPWKEPTW